MNSAVPRRTEEHLETVENIRRALHTSHLWIFTRLGLTLFFLRGRGSFTSVSESLESVMLEADEGLSGGEESISRGPSLSFISEGGRAGSWTRRKNDNHCCIKVKTNARIQSDEIFEGPEKAWTQTRAPPKMTQYSSQSVLRRRTRNF